jgi:hypothetical protein
VAALLADLRFEGLDRAKDKVHRFMAESWADRSTDHVPLFVASHGREVRHATCYIPVEFLSVTSATELRGVRLLPVEDPKIPPPSPWFVLAKPTGCVAAVEAEGSSFARMADRARDRVNHLLRATRIAQSAHHGAGRNRPAREHRGRSSQRQPERRPTKGAPSGSAFLQQIRPSRSGEPDETNRTDYCTRTASPTRRSRLGRHRCMGLGWS